MKNHETISDALDNIIGNLTHLLQIMRVSSPTIPWFLLYQSRSRSRPLTSFHVTSDFVLAVKLNAIFRLRFALSYVKETGTGLFTSAPQSPSSHLTLQKHLCRPARRSQYRSNSTPALAEELFGSLQTHPRCICHSTFAFASHRRTTLSPTRARNPAQSDLRFLLHQPLFGHNHPARELMRC